MDPQAMSLCPQRGLGAIPALRENDAPLRLQCVNREDVVPVPARLRDLLPPEHLACQVWRWVEEKLDLSAFYEPLRVQVGGRGRPAIDPKILVALWFYATSQGVSEASDLAGLCVEHLAYIWLCGGVRVSHHTLSTFRMAHLVALDDLLTRMVQSMQAEGLVGFEVHAQDGMRVRASAGASSFHRKATLEKHLHTAQARKPRDLAPRPPATSPMPVGTPAQGEAELRAEAPAERPAASPPTRPLSQREQAARRRAAEEELGRLQMALAELPKVEEAKALSARKNKQRKPSEPRVSSTDPQARVMKMGDGGFRPAYNWQFATDARHGVIVGVSIANAGTDQLQMEPMLQQVLQRYGRLPTYWEVDGGFVKLPVLEAWDARVCILMPVPEPRTHERYAPRPGDSPVLAAWRTRMGSHSMQCLYKLRAATAERVNADARQQHDVQQVGVRGPSKVLSVALWVALVHNLLIWIRHGQPRTPAAAGPQTEKGGT